MSLVSRRSMALAPASLMRHVTWLRPLRDISREDLEIRRWLENSERKDICCIIIAYIMSHKLTVFMPIFNVLIKINKKVDSMHNIVHTHIICNVMYILVMHIASYIKILLSSLVWARMGDVGLTSARPN